MERADAWGGGRGINEADTGERTTLTCNWLFCASGYYRYDEGFTPRFEQRERFLGPFIHPQQWPADLDYAGQRVLVIGSGATAVTLVPAIADTAAHVTMLQRTPSYVMPLPSKDKAGNLLRALLGEDRGYAVTRRKNIIQQQALWRLCQKYPNAARRLIRNLNVKMLPAGYPVDEHFNPPYNPWDQRMLRRTGRRPVQGHQQRARVGRHRPHRDIHREGRAAGVRSRAGSGHHRHGDRPERARDGRHVADRGRPAYSPAGHDRL